VIDDLTLRAPRQNFIASLANESVEQLKNRFIDWKLDIYVRNARGGPGSITKPSLLIRFPGSRKAFFARREESELFPRVRDHEECNRRQEGITTQYDKVEGERIPDWVNKLEF
tara:strand:- start:177 stop:515 length:339 start_codon:yes stop_codon:yes gene_type:complete